MCTRLITLRQIATCPQLQQPPLLLSPSLQQLVIVRLEVSRGVACRDRHQWQDTQYPPAAVGDFAIAMSKAPTCICTAPRRTDEQWDTTTSHVARINATASSGLVGNRRRRRRKQQLSLYCPLAADEDGRRTEDRNRKYSSPGARRERQAAAAAGSCKPAVPSAANNNNIPPSRVAGTRDWVGFMGSAQNYMAELGLLKSP